MSSVIHFLNTGNSDCIILESNGHFAMIDAGEDSDYPKNKPHLNYKGYEKEVCEYLIKNCKNKNGRVVLDFIMGTHSHSDHIGGFDTVILNDKIDVKKAYLKPYHEENIFIGEKIRWDNREVYEQMKSALEKKNIPIITSFEETIENIGNIKIKFFNGKYKKPRFKFGENVHSVVTLAETGKHRILLAGDMNYKNGGEKELSKRIGKINLLKVGHHGYLFSTSCRFVKSLMPEYAVVCGQEKRIYPDVRSKLKRIANAQILSTVDSNGIRAIFIGNKIEIQKDIM